MTDSPIKLAESRHKSRQSVGIRLRTSEPHLKINCLERPGFRSRERKFAERIRPMIDRIIANIQESRTLAALRDALLPKLLCGELRVPNSEREK